MSQLSNVESLLTAIAKGDSSYLVEPQSRVEALLYEIYLSGGGGGTGDITRAEVLRLLADKVDKLVGYGLISDEEAERLKNVDNYDDSEVRGLITDISNSIPTIEVSDGKSLTTEEGFAKIVDWDKNIGEYDITVCGTNLFDGTVKHGIYLHSETGLEFAGTANTSCTGFIPLMSNNAFIDTSSVYNFIYRYDKDQNFISPRQPISTRTFDDNVKYIRLASVESANFDDLIVSNSESPYEAYKSETFHITNDTLPFTITTYSPVTNILAPSYVKTFIGENEQGKYFVDMSDKADTTELNYVKDTIKGTAEGQFIYDTEAKMTKVVPDGVNKGIMAMIGGKTEKGRNLFDITNIKTLIDCKVENNVITNTKADTRNTAKIRVVAGSTMVLSDQLLSKPDRYIFTFTSTIVSSELTIKNSGSQIDTGITVNMETSIVKDHIYTVSFDAIAVNPSIVGGLVLSNIQVEEGSTASAYEPYHEDLWNAPVDKISINNKIIPIPSAILNLPDYGCSAGDVYNYVDFEEMVYHHRVGSIDMSTLKDTGPSGDYFYAVDLVSVKKSGNYNLLCSKYNTTSGVVTADMVNMEIKGNANNGNIYWKDNKYTSITDLKGVILNYELAEEELIPLTDILMPFMLESGGTITFENEHNLDVPNTVIYEKEMK